MKRFKTVDEFIDNQDQWKEALLKLRTILLKTDVEETVKWGAPAYTVNGKNVVGLGSFKSYVELWFFQGALLSDPLNLLINAQEGKTVAMRQMRFEGENEIDEKKILMYVNEAINNQKRGLEIKASKDKPLNIPIELKNAMEINLNLKEAFENFTLFKKREFSNYIKDAKRPATKLSRLDKIIPMIFEGRGLHDKYRSN